VNDGHYLTKGQSRSTLIYPKDPLAVKNYFPAAGVPPRPFRPRFSRPRKVVGKGAETIRHRPGAPGPAHRQKARGVSFNILPPPIFPPERTLPERGKRRSALFGLGLPAPKIPCANACCGFFATLFRVRGEHFTTVIAQGAGAAARRAKRPPPTRIAGSLPDARLLPIIKTFPPRSSLPAAAVCAGGGPFRPWRRSWYVDCLTAGHQGRAAPFMALWQAGILGLTKPGGGASVPIPYVCCGRWRPEQMGGGPRGKHLVYPAVFFKRRQAVGGRRITRRFFVWSPCPWGSNHPSQEEQQ